MNHAIRLTVTGPSLKQSHVFRRFPVRIGRDPEVDVRLGFPFVSRRHAQIEIEDGRLVLFDSGSSHGTYVRGGAERVQERVALDQVGGEFQIGALTLRACLLDESNLRESPTVDEFAPATREVEGPDFRSFTRTYAEAAMNPTEADSPLAQARAHLLEERARTSGETETAFASQVALESILARYLSPAPVLDSRAKVEEFARRLDTALRCLMESASTLLSAYERETEGAHQALRAKDLAAALLDPQEGEETARLVQHACAALAGHRAQIARAGLEGVGALLREISPESLRHSTRGAFPTRARWREYARRHQELSKLSAETIVRFFGVAFARACATATDEPRSSQRLKL